MKLSRPPTPGLGLANRLHSESPKKVTSVFPAKISHLSLPKNTYHSYPFFIAQNYELAVQHCHAQVQSIIEQCKHNNTKFRDPEFDIETDFAAGNNNYLFGLAKGCAANVGKSSLQTPSRHFKNSKDDDDALMPGSVHRIPWIFENPHFSIDGYSKSNIQQGASGDCWWLAALGTIIDREELMEKICVARYEEVGVYGFVFHRQGEWVATVVDDNLYLTEPDFDTDIFDATGHKARSYRKQKQNGSEALFFAKCGDSNETWLPLLEKAYAKVHGDYQALDGGWTGAAMEDLTGGITNVIASNSILYKERLWDELLCSRGDDGHLIFAVSSGPGDNHNNGLVLSHAYSVLEAVEMEKQHGGIIRLVKIRNPWGQRSDGGCGEWQGPWADGSKEWNAYTINALHYEFGDNGVFLMTFEDMLENFKYIYRTRLLNSGWSMTQRWTMFLVPWLPGFLRKRFLVHIEEKGQVVIVLSQLDDRFFPGLQGEYDFTLHFILRSVNLNKDVCRVSPCRSGDGGSMNCELHLEAGTYEVVPKLIALKNGLFPVEEMVKLAAIKAPEKLRQVGLQFDLSHAKEGIRDQMESVNISQDHKHHNVNDGGDRRHCSNLASGSSFSVPAKDDHIKVAHELTDCHATDSEPKMRNEPNAKNRNANSEVYEDTGRHHWGPVCIVSLRVYAQHVNLTVSVTEAEAEAEAEADGSRPKG